MFDYVDVVTVLARVSSLCALLCARQKKKALRSPPSAISRMFKTGRDHGGMDIFLQRGFSINSILLNRCQLSSALLDESTTQVVNPVWVRSARDRIT